MSEPITQAEADEIMEFCATHPNVRIQMDDDGSWCISVVRDKYMSWMHPRVFLDIIRANASEFA